MMNQLKATFYYLLSKRKLVAQLLLLQGVTAAASALYGLLCVRLLPASGYAEFVVVFGVQNTVLVLMDANFSNSLIPLVGERVHDHAVIADYLASLRKLAVRMYLLVGAGLVVLFPALVRNRHWDRTTVLAMVLTLLASTWFQRMGAQYGAVLILLRERSLWYQAQLVSSLGTLALLFVFWGAHWLTPFAAILINVAGLVYIGAFYAIQARRILGTTGKPTAEKQSAIVRLALPNLPNTIFYALQGQISLYLITIFGRTVGIAGLGALNRLSQIYLIFGHVLPMLVEPYFAKLPKARLKANYLVATALTLATCLAITAFAYLFPGIFLWVLGPQYANLRFEVFLTIASSSVAYMSGTLWIIHSARKFVYWWSSAMSIVLTLLVQVLFIVKLDISTVRVAVLLNLATAGVALLVNACCGINGLLRGPRVVEYEPPAAPGFDTEPLDPLQAEVREMEAHE